MDEITTQPEVESVQPDTQVVETTKPEASQPTIKVKYNKEEKELSFDEAREYAEKGMNYDKIKERLQALEQEYEGVKKDRDSLKDSAELKWVQSQAVKRNMIPKDFVGLLIDTEYAKEHGVTVDEAKRVRLDNEQKQSLSTENETLKSKLTEIEQQQKEQERITEELKAFKDKYPDAPVPLPDGVIDKIKLGVPLIVAYEDYQSAKTLETRLKELEDKLKVDTVNKENADSSTGKIGDQGDTHEPELTDEVIANMTPAELKKNHSKIRKYLGWT